MALTLYRRSADRFI